MMLLDNSFSLSLRVGILTLDYYITSDYPRENEQGSNLPYLDEDIAQKRIGQANVFTSLYT